MPRRRSTIGVIRSILDALERFLGALSAGSKGPGAMSRRLGRRTAGSVTGLACMIYGLSNGP